MRLGKGTEVLIKSSEKILVYLVFLLGDLRTEISSTVILLSLPNICHICPIISPHGQVHEYSEQELWSHFEVNVQHL